MVFSIILIGCFLDAWNIASQRFRCVCSTAKDDDSAPATLWILANTRTLTVPTQVTFHGFDLPSARKWCRCRAHRSYLRTSLESCSSPYIGLNWNPVRLIFAGRWRSIVLPQGSEEQVFRYCCSPTYFFHSSRDRFRLRREQASATRSAERSKCRDK